MTYIERARQALAYASQCYRHLHAYPDPSHGEMGTHAIIREALTADGIPFDAPTDNITIARIGSGAPVVGLRCDTDALQVTEETNLPYASKKPGLMHACGHDLHIAAGLTAARILKDAPLPGTVKIIFQPAEEGELGAQEVLRTGLVKDVNAFFAIHCWSGYEVGALAVSPHGVCASTDMFTLTIRGHGGHGALPEQCVDAIVCASALVGALQTISSRLVSPMEPVVVTIGSFHAGTRCNIIAGEAVLEGTIRTFNPDVYDRVHAHFDRIVKEVCAAYGCTYDIDMRPACGVTWNDDHLVQIAREAALRVAPPSALIADSPCMMGDDFADYRAVAPTCYVKVGVRNEAIGACYPHHHPRFRADENALPVMAAWLCEMAAGAIQSIGDEASLPKS